MGISDWSGTSVNWAAEPRRVWMPPLMQAVFRRSGTCDLVRSCVRPRNAASATPRARMEMCGSRPYRVCALEALGAVQVARDPVSSTDVPYPSSTSRIAGPPTSRLNSGDGGILVERLARRDRPDHSGHLICQCHDDQHMRLAGHHPREPAAGFGPLSGRPGHHG